MECVELSCEISHYYGFIFGFKCLYYRLIGVNLDLMCLEVVFTLIGYYNASKI